MTLRYDTASGQWIDSDENQTRVKNPNVEQAATESPSADQTAAQNTSVEQAATESPSTDQTAAQNTSVEQAATESPNADQTAAQNTGADAVAEQVTAAGSAWQNNTYSPIPEEPKKEKSRIPVIIGVIVASCLCLGVAIAVAIGGKGKASQKILQALQNTFKNETHTAKLLEQFEKLVQEGYTISMTASTDDTHVSMEYRNDFNEPQLWMSYEDYWMEEVELLASLTDSKVKVLLPALSDYVFTYNYQEKKTGYLVENAEDAEYLDELDLVLEYLYEMNNMTDQESYDEELIAIFMEEFMSWKFEEIEAKTFKVNEERIKCEGYKTTLDAEQMIALVEEVETFYQEYELDYWEDFSDYMENPFDSVYAELEDMLDVEISFYLTQEQVACILMESEGEKIKISFKGNANGAQDIEIEVDNYSLMEITHETDKTQEKTTIAYMGADMLTFSYDYEEHDFSLGFEYDYTDIQISGTMEINEEQLKMSVDTLYFVYELIDNLEFEIAVKKGAELQEIVGEEFDIGNATEDEFYKVISEISDNYLGDDINSLADPYNAENYYDDDFADLYDMTPQELYEEYFYDMTPEEFLELFPEYTMEDITGESDL